MTRTLLGISSDFSIISYMLPLLLGFTALLYNFKFYKKGDTAYGLYCIGSWGCGR